MATRTPYNPKKKKPSLERQKRIAAIKTAIPLVITFGLLIVLYIFVLRPEEPARILKRAVINSTDSSKYSSIRYDGTFGDTNRGISGEFAGQKASNGDHEFRIRLKDEDITTALHTMTVADQRYVMIEGVENLKAISSKITGFKEISDQLITAMNEVQNTWVRVDESTMGLVDKNGCFESLPSYGPVPRQLTDETYPLVYVSGPVSPKDDTENQIFEAKLATGDRTQGDLESQFTAMVNCFETSFGEDDFRLREATEADIEAVKVTVLIDPLSNTVQKLTMKQVGMYYTLNLRDYNKDVVFSAPQDSVAVTDLYAKLSPGSRAYLLESFGIPAL